MKLGNKNVPNGKRLTNCVSCNSCLYFGPLSRRYFLFLRSEVNVLLNRSLVLNCSNRKLKILLPLAQF